MNKSSNERRSCIPALDCSSVRISEPHRGQGRETGRSRYCHVCHILQKRVAESRLSPTCTEHLVMGANGDLSSLPQAVSKSMIIRHLPGECWWLGRWLSRQECLLSKLEDLSLNPQHPSFKITEHSSTKSSIGRREQILGARWLAKSAKTVGFEFSNKAGSSGGRFQNSPSGVCMCY